MNDLFSSNSFKKYADLKHQIHNEETDSDSNNLDKFFNDVEIIKEEIKSLEQHYQHLQDLNEKTKSSTNSKMLKSLRNQMDSDTEKVLLQAKSVKQKLEFLDRVNKSNRNVPGCSADRSRSLVIGGLGKNLKDLMNDFQNLRNRIASDYREIVGRRYYTVTGEKLDEENLEILILSGESEGFLQRAIEEQGKGEILEAISEIQERFDGVKEIERSLIDLHQIFLDIAVVVEAQGEEINDIESHVAKASSFVRRGTFELEESKDYKKSTRKWYCIAFLIGCLIVFILLFPIFSNLFESK